MLVAVNVCRDRLGMGVFFWSKLVVGDTKRLIWFSVESDGRHCSSPSLDSGADFLKY